MKGIDIAVVQHLVITCHPLHFRILLSGIVTVWRRE